MRPLTVLVGRNSSGKSSFLRFLPLLRQSIEARTTGPIQWYGDYVDFGGFDETVSSFSDKKEMRFGFRLSLDHRALRQYRVGRFAPFRVRHGQSNSTTPTWCDVILTIIPDPRDNSVTRFQSITFKAAGHAVHFDIESTTGIANVVINKQQMLGKTCHELNLSPGGLLPLIHRQPSSSKVGDTELRYARWAYSRSLAVDELVEVLRPMFHGRTIDKTIFRVANSIPFGTNEEIFSHLTGLGWPGKRWKESVGHLRLSSVRFKRIRDLVVANSLGAIIAELDRQLCGFATGVSYAKPVRATAERYYRQQGLAVDEVDPEGRNLAMFLRSLTEAERQHFERWTSEELGWKIVTRLAGGHVSLRIHERGARSYNLTDVGFGFSQVLPVLAQLWSMQHGRRRRRRYADHMTFAIEQPELHLHPALQARLADVLIRAISSAHGKTKGLTTIVETHSEAIVNRIGQQIASGNLAPDDATVVLFDMEGPDGASRVTIAAFDSRGFLRNWPFGFFEPE